MLKHSDDDEEEESTNLPEAKQTKKSKPTVVQLEAAKKEKLLNIAIGQNTRFRIPQVRSATW